MLIACISITKEMDSYEVALLMNYTVQLLAFFDLFSMNTMQRFYKIYNISTSFV